MSHYTKTLRKKHDTLSLSLVYFVAKPDVRRLQAIKTFRFADDLARYGKVSKLINSRAKDEPKRSNQL